MRSSLVNPCKPFPALRIALIAGLTLLSSGWTCNAMFEFHSCQSGGAQTQITALSPATVFRDAESLLLTVEGSGFTPQSQITWNGSTLQTTFTDSRHLQTTITQQTFDFFGGSAGTSVQISVRSQGSVADMGCPKNGNAGTLLLVIN
jgi:hypothetical protein